MNFDALFEQFIREKIYLDNVSRHTSDFYRRTWEKLGRLVGTERLDNETLHTFVVRMREKGLCPQSVNDYTASLNSFLSWLYNNGHLTDRLRIKRLKVEQKVIQTFSEAQLNAILSFKPKTFLDWRLYALCCLLIDTGLRISEALTIRMHSVDFDNMLIKVRGKGNKERVVPMSPRLRQILVRYLKKRTAPGDFLFCTSTGGEYIDGNARKNLKDFCTVLGITGVRCSFHTFRHTFAYMYARSFAKLTGSAENGILHLQKQLGHTTLAMTRRYVELQPEDLQAAHTVASPLSQLK
jgi:site-specific recombinase XerD